MATRPVTFRAPTIDQILPPSVREAVLRKVALMAIGMIKRRTKAGVDVEGRPFKPYSMGYAEQRRKAGWSASPADLWLTGSMLNSMGILEASPAKVLIGFSGSSASVKWQRRAKPRKHKKTGAKVTHTFSEQNEQVANAAKAYWNDKGDGPPRRHFFGLSAAEKAELTKYALREMLKLAAQVSLNRAAGRR
jgi:hypothetical protein